jgi:uncharacterized protein YcbX
MHLTGLNVYPVKSCAGIGVDRATVTSRGFAGDRRFMVVDETGRFLTQRVLPQMSQIHCAFDSNQLTLRATGRPDLKLPRALAEGSRTQVDVWRDTCDAVVHDEASAWLSTVLDRDVRLVYMPDDVRRSHGDGDGLVSFADGYPYLLTTEASLADLNARLAEPVTMDRFRPNVVVDGLEAFAEDGWTTITIGSVQFRVTKPCDRCVLTTVDPQTGIKGKEPLRTLSTYRKLDAGVCFGMNLVATSTGEVAVGDPVRVQ